MTPTPPAFIVNIAVVNRTATTNPDLVDGCFNTSSTFQTSNTGVSLYTPNAFAAMSFADETKLEAAIANGLPPRTIAVLYDNEAWSGTPADQQQDPATYYQAAAAAIHAVDLWLIAAPGTDLANVYNPGPGPQWQRYLESNIAGLAAEYADIYEVQAQSYQGDLATYSGYVHQAAAQAVAANPNVPVMAGLTTNHGGTVYTGQQMLDAAQAVQDVAWGFWLNDPAGGPMNPGGTGPYPQVVVDFLSNL